MRKLTSKEHDAIHADLCKTFSYPDYAIKEIFKTPKVIKVTEYSILGQGNYAFAVAKLFDNTYVCVKIDDHINVGVGNTLTWTRGIIASKSAKRRFELGMNHGDLKRKFYIGEYYKAITKLFNWRDV